MIEIGRIAIAVEVSMMASYTSIPRIGHLEAILHMFAYLSQHNRAKLVFDDSYMEHEMEPKQDWTGFYPDVKENMPPKAPEPRGRTVEMTAFVDADHAGDMMTWRSQTGVLIYLNRSPIVWYTKKQNSVETSAFDSKFMALKTAVELIKGLRYKLRMLGIPIQGHTHVKVENMSVVTKMTAPESTLKKKSNAIAYHFVGESVAADIIRITFENSELNFADFYIRYTLLIVAKGL